MSHHFSKRAVIRCSDDRYQTGRELFDVYQSILKAENIDINDPYELFNLGAGIDFQVDPNCRALQLMVKAIKKLGIEKVVLIEHTPDCGAYTITFDNPDVDTEKDLHLRTIEMTKKFFAQNLPDVELACYLQINNTGFEKIF